MEQGYRRYVNGHETSFEEPPTQQKFHHDIDVRTTLYGNEDRKQRLTEAVESALRLGGGTLAVESLEAPSATASGAKTRMHLTEEGQTIAWSKFCMPEHGTFMPELRLECFRSIHPRCVRYLPRAWRSTAVQRRTHRRWQRASQTAV